MEEDALAVTMNNFLLMMSLVAWRQMWSWKKGNKNKLT
jgi:hypothetical protein